MDINLVVFDFDGVFTDGKVYFSEDGKVQKRYEIKDGMALSLLKNKNIKTGVISNFKNQEINQIIISHLKFDIIYFGENKKENILLEWLKELNLRQEQVAYIGDDINDIPVLKQVKFSACPNDATFQVKEIVDYVCEKKGGEGCVREFVDKILFFSQNWVEKISFEIKKEIIYQILNFKYDKMQPIINLIKNSNLIFCTGVGKSETMAIHFSNLLKSINIKSNFLNPINALHGDLGNLNEDDLVFFFSKSGNTKELIEIIPFLKNKKIKIIGIFCEKNSILEPSCNLVCNIPFQREIQGNITSIPTNSCMSQLLFINIIISKLKEEITLDLYKENHPAGNIGENLKKIKECILLDFPNILFQGEVKLYNVLLAMTTYKKGCCFFVDEKNILLGILTDGDIRRILLKDENKKIIYQTDLNQHFYYESDLEKYIKECKKLTYIPVCKNYKSLIGIVDNFTS
jgi:arabinose-5-phosphate isomerase